MCDSNHLELDGDVPGETLVYRGCGNENYLTPRKDAVRDKAFLKKGAKHTRGLSVATSAIHSVKGFTGPNYGAIRIYVRDIIAAGLRLTPPRNITVKIDERDLNHLLVRNMPCTDLPLEQADANALAELLAKVAEVESSVHIVVPAGFE